VSDRRNGREGLVLGVMKCKVDGDDDDDVDEGDNQ